MVPDPGLEISRASFFVLLLGTRQSPFWGPPTPCKCANLALSPVLLRAKVEVKMSVFPGGHPMPSSHAVPSSLCLFSLGVSHRVGLYL